MLGSDAGSDGAKPASSFIIENCQTSCSVGCLIYGARYKNVVCGLFDGVAHAIRWRSETPFVHRRMESPNTSSQAIELTQSVRAKLIPTGLALVLGMKTRSLDVFSQYPALH